MTRLPKCQTSPASLQARISPVVDASLVFSDIEVIPNYRLLNDREHRIAN